MILSVTVQAFLTLFMKNSILFGNLASACDFLMAEVILVSTLIYLQQEYFF